MQNYIPWFPTQVERWRTGASVAWTCLLLWPLTAGYLIGANLDWRHPTGFITDTLLTLLSPASWTYVFILTFTAACVAIWNSTLYSVRMRVESFHLACLWNLLMPARLMHAGIHLTAGALSVWCLVSMSGQRYAGLIKQCSQNSYQQCLNEHHLYLVLHGCYVGWLYSVRFFLNNLDHVTFPILQEPKFFQVKSRLCPLVLASIKQILRQMLYFHLLYYIVIGPVMKQFILGNLQVSESEDEGVSTLLGLLDLRLLWQALTSGTLVLLTFNLARLLYRVYQTEHLEFVIEQDHQGAPAQGASAQTLQSALNESRYPLLKYLGYLDLYLLAKHSCQKRRIIFSLSQPGGHPHNWTSVSTQCLALLNNLTQAVTDFNNKAMASGPNRQLSGGDKVMLQSQKGNTSMSAPVTPMSQTQLSSPFGVDQRGPAHTPSNLTYRGPVQTPSNVTGIQDVPKIVEKPPPTLWQKVWEQLKKRKAVAYFLSEPLEVTSRRLFIDCQIHIWAAQALAYLAAASYTEDMFGVVQKSLPSILTTLLSLQEAIEKQLKLVPLSSSRRSSRESSCDVALPNVLRSSLKSAIYKIVVTFEKDISAVPLSTEQRRRLQHFKDFKE